MMHGNGWYGNNNYSFMGGNMFSWWNYLILIGVIILIIALILLARKNSNNNGNQALKTLKELYVKGEVTEEEYFKRKNVIERQ